MEEEAEGGELMEQKHRFYHSIFIQAVFIVMGLAQVSLALSIFIFQQNVKTMLMKEVENKAAIFLYLSPYK
jgi:hypothetical protein